jgi:hypothetical protein
MTIRHLLVFLGGGGFWAVGSGRISLLGGRKKARLLER